jgi:site-specific recombinase XerD
MATEYPLSGPAREQPAALTPLPPPPPGFDPDDVRALADDFHRWLREVWRRPQHRPATEGGDAPLVGVTFFQPAPEGRYTIHDLVAATGISQFMVEQGVRGRGLRPIGRRSQHDAAGRRLPGGAPMEYSGRDLAPLADFWQRKRLHAAVDERWGCFVPEPCGTCRKCAPVRVSFECETIGDSFVRRTRRGLAWLLDGVRARGSLAAWWREAGLPDALGPFTSRAVNEKRGLILLYLLDRQLVVVSSEEMWRIHFAGLPDVDLLRPWRGHRPDEAAAFDRGLAGAHYGESFRAKVPKALALLLLTRGFPGVAELARPLGPDAIRHAVRQGRLLTKHITNGIYLPSPLQADIRVGHLLLDDLRREIWAYGAACSLRAGKAHWNRGPWGWDLGAVAALEGVLTAEVWGAGGDRLLPRRPDIEGKLFNPALLRRDAERIGVSATLLPPALRRALEAYVERRFAVRRIAFTTLRTELGAVLAFLAWARERGDLGTYWGWGPRDFARILRAYRAERLQRYTPAVLHGRLSSLLTFFDTLAQLDLDPPQPTGYHMAIEDLLPRLRREERRVPREALLDRVFRDGVCRLDYDPMSRLALTVMYYCGTRNTETCDLHLFCVLEDADGVRLLIPLGKGGQERVFPIVAEGMEPLIRAMDEVVESQLATVDTPGGPRKLPKTQAATNYRYLDSDRAKALRWHYLFDRGADANPGRRGRNRLSDSRVRDALWEAVTLAARANPAGFFREGTWSSRCRRRRRCGLRCRYFSARDGIVVCPACGGPLPGRRGVVCSRILTADIACDGEGARGDWFCPKCDHPLAEFVEIVPHIFRHNSVSRAHRRGVSLEANMALHGHQTVPMHLRYVHLLPEDQEAEVRRVFEEERFRDIRLAVADAPGQLVVDGVPHTPTAEELARYTLVRGLARRTHGLWGGFWVGALAEDGGAARPGDAGGGGEIVITEDTYHHAVAQYRWQALALAVSAVALARGVPGKFSAEVPDFLEGRAIESLVAQHLTHVREHLASPLYVRLMARDVEEQRAFLRRLEELLRPWWEPQGSIGALVRAFVPEDVDDFQAP